jgi:hypothetical protein
MGRYSGALKTSPTRAVVSMILITRILDQFRINLSLSARNINSFSAPSSVAGIPS